MANQSTTPAGSKAPATPNKSKIQELPMATEEESEYPDEEMTYIAYGERGEDVAFEISDNIEEAVEIYQSMKEDGFAVKLYQAQELEIVDN
jgi:hypothetical protein